jgi:hypothetical protein
MKVKKAKEAARTREKKKNAAAQTEIDRTDPEYTPLNDGEDIALQGPGTSESKSRTKKPAEARFYIFK